MSSTIYDNPGVRRRSARWDLKEVPVARPRKPKKGECQVGVAFMEHPTLSIGPVEQLHPAFASCQVLMNAKSQDYGAVDFAKVEYFPFGDESYGTMIHTKYKRVMNLIEKKKRGDAVNFESLKDSVGDLINYAAFYWAYLDAEEKSNAPE